jgi:hypothetical protein
MYGVLWIVIEIEIYIINFMSFFGFVFLFIYLFLEFQVSRCWVLNFLIYDSTIRLYYFTFDFKEFGIIVSCFKVLDFLICNVHIQNYLFKVSNVWL